VFALDEVFGAAADRIGCKMRDDLVTIEIEVDPLFRASPLRTAEQPAVEAPRSREIIDRKGKMEGRQTHRGCNVTCELVIVEAFVSAAYPLAIATNALFSLRIACRRGFGVRLRAGRLLAAASGRLRFLVRIHL